MPDFRIIKMCHLSPLHIGTGRESYDVAASELHSDTLSAALASMAVTCGLTDDTASFLSSFRLSSAFPFWKDHYFLPRPAGLLDVVVDGVEEHDYRKRLKKIRYIEIPLWEQIASGRTLHVKMSQLRGAFLVTEGVDDMAAICKSQVSQRVSVPRDGVDDASPFFFDWHFYDESAGLYCLTDAAGPLADTLTTLFGSLGDAGIGTDKSVGGGHFDVETASISIPEPAGANASVTLSLFLPSEEEFSGLFAASPRYSLLLRGGYMAGSSVERFRHLRKRSVYMFGEGSVFFTAGALQGTVVDLRPEWNDAAMHPVMRSGRTLSLKIKSTAYE